MPERGDVVVFRPEISDDKEYFIKRIVGMPGDTIKIEEGKVYILDTETGEYLEIQEDYLDENNNGKTYVRGANGKKVYNIPDDGYFVM